MTRLLRPILIVLLACLALPAQADDAALLDRALAGARAQFAQALPRLGENEFGVDVASYRKALALEDFTAGAWKSAVRVAPKIRAKASGSCQDFAAFVRIPPDKGVVPLVLCPQFFTPGADRLRVLTILHEMVHAVAGRDECQAMAFAARVEQLATGRLTPVDAYWRANKCASSAYRLP
ncbi:MAG: hypothetical protein ACOH2L_08085 [Devosia sp.]